MNMKKLILLLTFLNGTCFAANGAERAAISSPKRCPKDLSWVSADIVKEDLQKKPFIRFACQVDGGGELAAFMRRQAICFEVECPHSSKIRGSQLFDLMIARLSAFNPTSIHGTWMYGTNLGQMDAYFEKHPEADPTNIEDIKKAIQTTWTAKRCHEHGFSEITIKKCKQVERHFTDMTVEFKKN